VGELGRDVRRGPDSTPTRKRTPGDQFRFFTGGRILEGDTERALPDGIDDVLAAAFDRTGDHLLLPGSSPLRVSYSIAQCVPSRPWNVRYTSAVAYALTVPADLHTSWPMRLTVSPPVSTYTL
jgi:hypothetical protein